MSRSNLITKNPLRTFNLPKRLWGLSPMKSKRLEKSSLLMMDDLMIRLIVKKRNAFGETLMVTHFIKI